MDPAILSDEVRAALERIGTADLVVGLATAGPIPALGAVAAAVRAGLDSHFAGHSLAIVHVDQAPAEATSAAVAAAFGDLRVVPVTSGPRRAGDEPLDWAAAVRALLTAGRVLQARAIVMLNAELSSMTPEWLRGLAGPVVKEDYGLVLPIYRRYRYDGTLTQALVVPLMRSLFGRQLAHPLAEEFACSGPAADTFLKESVWETDLGRHGLEFWLPAAAIEHGLGICQAVLGPRTVVAAARPAAAPLGRTVGRVAGALFALAERAESFWPDIRGSEPVISFGVPPEPLPGGPAVDPSLMQVGFVQGVRDLLPVWERILAPDNLGEVLELSDRPLDRFRVSDRLWSRIVYDFLLAYRARVVYRSHAVQSLAPLYLGRAASVVLETQTRPPAAMSQSAARLGGMFEEEKPYLVDRWR
jgi:glucosylglycerate synthase